jgi:hypothetical protein
MIYRRGSSFATGCKSLVPIATSTRRAQVCHERETSASTPPKPSTWRSWTMTQRLPPAGCVISSIPFRGMKRPASSAVRYAPYGQRADPLGWPRNSRAISQSSIAGTRRVSWLERNGFPAHAERVSQSWLRRRVFWQVLSDLFVDDRMQPSTAEDDVRRVLDFLQQLAPKHRGAIGLFLDTDDPQLLQAQTEAISALARLLATDCGDWRSFLAEGGRP